MAVRPPPKRPVIFAVGFLDWQVVDAREAPPHQPRLVELPVFVTVGAEPLTRFIVPFVREANRDPIRLERPALLDEPVVDLPGPFAGEESDNRFAALREFRTVSPSRVERVGKRDPNGVARIPGVFRQ